MIELDYKSREPIYVQLKKNIIQDIMLGELKADEQLPAVRQLAQDLGINPNTVQKTYRELERDGIIYSLPGKGSFVNERAGVVDTVRELHFNKLTDLVNQCIAHGIPSSEILEVVQRALKTEGPPVPADPLPIYNDKNER